MALYKKNGKVLNYDLSLLRNIYCMRRLNVSSKQVTIRVDMTTDKGNLLLAGNNNGSSFLEMIYVILNQDNNLYVNHMTNNTLQSVKAVTEENSRIIKITFELPLYSSFILLSQPLIVEVIYE